jgi:hypothetical protein
MNLINSTGFDMNIYAKKLYLYGAIICTTFLLAACGSDYNDNDEPEQYVEPEYVFTPTLSYEVTLTGNQEVPVNGSTQTATALIEVDEDDGILRANIDVSAVEGFVAAHLHEGGLGQNGAIFFTFTEGSGTSYNGTSTNNATQSPIDNATIEALKAGNVYANLHTTDFPSGEIRAQVVADTVTITSFKADGSQEVPAVESLATATGYASYDSATTALKLRLNTQELDDATAAHIHTGRIGNNGSILIALEEDAETSSWNSPENATLDAETFELLASGGHYVNIHTPANPSGEVRGQILTANFALMTFPIEGSQEVPAVSTMASGDGYMLVDTNSLSAELVALTQGVEDATMAHIHAGRIGSNGSVLVALEQSLDDANVWNSPDEFVLDVATFEVLVAGGHYVNVHTPTNPRGELRGQILTDEYVLATFPLEGSQEVPAVSTSATGDGYALINTDTFSVEIKLLTDGVMNATMAHIHAGRIGNNGDVLVALEQASDNPNVWITPTDFAIDADIFAQLASGGQYVNVHTPANPSGELRGQILTRNYALATFSLQGSQEVPAVNTDASGNGYALVNTSDYSLELTLVTVGVMDASMAHIHTGRIGANGPILIALEQAPDDANIWNTPADSTIDADTFNVLAMGGHYVNVHTPANPSGELRGQILTDNYTLFTFPLSGEQEVPAVVTDASGRGYALVNTDNFGLELVAITQGVDDATMAHIHAGDTGSNGSVLVGLERAEDTLNIWLSPADFTVNEDVFSLLITGGHYVNVHTPANPSGELRGQIQ